jgi:hypothetical protein
MVPLAICSSNTTLVSTTVGEPGSRCSRPGARALAAGLNSLKPEECRSYAAPYLYLV